MFRPRWWVFLIALVIAVSSCIQAQNRTTGEIRGTVTDTSGAVVPGVQIGVFSADIGVKQAISTDSSGSA